jgi:hypothetical protein
MKAQLQINNRESTGAALAVETLADEMEHRAETFERMRDALDSVLEAEHARQRQAWRHGPGARETGEHACAR